MEKTLQILVAEDGADVEDIAELTGYLREELLRLDVDDVTSVPGEEPPPGARVVEVAAIGALLVTLGSTVTGLRQVLDAIREWRGRCRESRPSLHLSLDDDVLEISEATDEQVARAFDMFLQRHSTAGAQP
ncbi:hypothetical protein ACIA8I_35235 [Streptomyces rishiriensis]|uniref:hypothetical protein n=1 Tax=Streptomyces rishiriensis TaxID=68264 RepID=UPI000D592D91|nr:hypothetical protein [Streptomyces rishiriensis]